MSSCHHIVQGTNRVRPAQNMPLASAVPAPVPSPNPTVLRPISAAPAHSTYSVPQPQAYSPHIPSNPNHATPLITTWSRDGSPAHALIRSPLPIISPLPQLQQPANSIVSNPDWVAPTGSWLAAQARSHTTAHEGTVASSLSDFGMHNGSSPSSSTPVIQAPVTFTAQPTQTVNTNAHVATSTITRISSPSVRPVPVPLFFPPSPTPTEGPTSATCPATTTESVVSAVSDRPKAPAVVPGIRTVTPAAKAVPLVAPTPSLTNSSIARAASSATSARQPPANQLYATVSSPGQFRPTMNEVDEELARAYGMELHDTGFQSWGQDSEDSSVGDFGKEAQVGAAGKPKTIKSPRQKKPAGTKWLGGPGGGMKFNSKPEGYDEGVGRRARWSYSEDGTNSQDVNEQIEGDVHFSPAIQYTPEDEPFMSWVCTLTTAGLLRWVHFNAGQPHPQFQGYVFKPAQLPRTSPRWLKEASYKSTQRS